MKRMRLSLWMINLINLSYILSRFILNRFLSLTHRRKAWSKHINSLTSKSRFGAISVRTSDERARAKLYKCLKLCKNLQTQRISAFDSSMESYEQAAERGNHEISFPHDLRPYEGRTLRMRTYRNSFVSRFKLDRSQSLTHRWNRIIKTIHVVTSKLWFDDCTNEKIRRLGVNK